MDISREERFTWYLGDVILNQDRKSNKKRKVSITKARSDTAKVSIVMIGRKR